MTLEHPTTDDAPIRVQIPVNTSATLDKMTCLECTSGHDVRFETETQLVAARSASK